MTQMSGREEPVASSANGSSSGLTGVDAAAPSAPVETDVERRAIGWIEPYNQAWHLERARDWLVYLFPNASLEMRLATVTHDIERMFPGGPSINKATCRWDDPDYLYAHGSRSADVVEKWLADQGAAGDGVDVAELRRLITLHEFGGLDGADAVQAADSLSFLETLREIVRTWVTSGECSVGQAPAKHQYMADRIRPPEAARLSEPLLERALASLDDLEPVT